MSVTRDYPWKDGNTNSDIGIERRSRLDGNVEVIPLRDAVDRLARATSQDRKLVTAGYEYELHEPGDPPDRPDRRDY